MPHLITWLEKVGEGMDKQEIRFAVVSSGKEVTRIGKSVIYQPLANYKGKETKWFDDSKLIKGRRCMNGQCKVDY